MGRLRAWFDERIDAEGWRRSLLEKPVGPHVNWLFTLGGVLLFLFALQAATGILLAVYYVASPLLAHQSVASIMSRVPLGWLVRGLHYWGASFMIVAAGLHLLRVVLYGAYKRPREVTWLAGVVLLLLILGFAFTGYLLPWDQKAYWATVVGTYIAGTVPFIGDALLHLLRGGASVGGPTLSRFYAIHTLLLPALAVAFIALHVYLVQLHGISEPFRRAAYEAAPDEETAARSPVEPSSAPALTRPFYPHHAFKDATAIVVVGVVLVGLAWYLRAPLEPIANPVDATYVPRPEWYFYPLYETLKFFNGRWLVVGTVVVPALFVAVLLCLPFLDRSPLRDPLSRPFVSAATVSVVAGCAYLVGVGAATHAPRRFFYVSEVSPAPMQLAGAVVFEQQSCESCHSVLGHGARSAPDLWRAGERHDRAWLTRLFQDPDAVLSPGAMPRFDLPAPELAALVDYVSSLDFSRRTAHRVSRPVARGGAEVSRSGCLACHGEDAADEAMRFSDVGRRRDLDWLEAYLTDPAFHAQIDPAAAQLDPARRREMAMYLARP